MASVPDAVALAAALVPVEKARAHLIQLAAGLDQLLRVTIPAALAEIDGDLGKALRGINMAREALLRHQAKPGEPEPEPEPKPGGNGVRA
jgi:hypothetical protein